MFYITTPIYYVNARPHIGHAYTTVAADVLARHHRQLGEETFLLTGTDEHGEPVARAAAALGVSPRELVDENSRHFRDLLDVIDCQPDFFIRTSDPGHGALVSQLLGGLRDSGFIYEGRYEGLYCEGCADFKSDRDINAAGECPQHPGPLTVQSEANWFFALTAFKDRLLAHLDANPGWIFPATRANEARVLIEEVQDISISRASISWGVPVPWDSDQVFYVWFDALLNYLTGPALAGADCWPADVQLLGKDILKFHAVIWPALLLALDLPLPRQLIVHGHLLNRGRKISKSLGNTIDPFDVAARYGSDALRLCLTRDVPFGADGNLDDLDSFAKARNELADGYGNLIRRVWTIAQRQRGSVLAAGPVPEVVLEALGDAPRRVAELLADGQVSGAAQAAWEAVRALNRAVEHLSPWKLSGSELDVALSGLVGGIRAVSVLLHPFCPDATALVLEALGASPAWKNATIPRQVEQVRLTELPVLYPKPERA